MRPTLLLFTAGFVGVVAVAPAAAQRSPVPDAGMVAIGAAVDAAVPTDGRLQTGPGVTVNVEGYLTPRVSIRGQFGAAKQDFVGQNFTGHVTPLYLDGNIVYNWEGGALHPYVTGGVGVYRYHWEENQFEGSDTSPGFNVGGGLEYFFHRHSTITGEVLYRRIGDITTTLAPFNSHGFWTFGVGLKKYF